MKVLVTGAAGFVGSCFCQHILTRHPGVEIIGLDNLITGFRENIDARIKFYDVDLVDHLKLEKIFQENTIDYIVHMAAFAAEALSNFVRRHTYNNNVIASTNLINCAINYGVKRFMFTSSIASYGNLSPPFTEDMTPCCTDIYGLSKFITEQDLRIASVHHGLEYVVIRPFNILGPKQSLNSRYRNVAGIFMNKLLDNEPLTLYGDGSQARAFSYIDDLLAPMWTALTDPKCANETYNLGSSKLHTVKDLAAILIKIAGRGEIQYLEARHEVHTAWCDVTKAKEQLGYEEKTDLETGLRIMWEWAEQQMRHPVESFKNIEIKKGLYTFWRD